MNLEAIMLRNTVTRGQTLHDSTCMGQLTETKWNGGCRGWREGRKEGAESQLASAIRFPAPWAGPHCHPGLSPGDGKEVQKT